MVQIKKKLLAHICTYYSIKLTSMEYFVIDFDEAMELPTKQTRLRNAEKHRKFSTCKFADRIFLCATKKLEDIIAQGHWPEVASPCKGIHNSFDSISKNERQQTVVAAFVIHDSKSDILECVSLGMGTKFVDYKRITNRKGNLMARCNLKCGSPFQHLIVKYFRKLPYCR